MSFTFACRDFGLHTHTKHAIILPSFMNNAAYIKPYQTGGHVRKAYPYVNVLRRSGEGSGCGPLAGVKSTGCRGCLRCSP